VDFIITFFDEEKIAYHDTSARWQAHAFLIPRSHRALRITPIIILSDAINQ
jgi:hypothetical protein